MKYDRGAWELEVRRMAQTKVAMIGDGNVGTALSKGLVRAGYEVQAIGKVPEKVRELARWGDIIVLAVPFSERADALKEMGDAFAGKPLVDVTNAFGREDTITQKSGAEELQEMARTAKVVKAFNTAFAHTMSTGQVLGDRITAFVAGDDNQAKERILRMARDIGFDAVDTGGLKSARWIEALGLFHIHLGYGQRMGPDTGFKLIHKGAVR
jgi:predicted dinucleotide-binding enzyme